MSRRAIAVAGAALLLAACGDIMSPLRKLAEPGLDPYMFFVAEGAGGRSDLFVARLDGSGVRQASYSPMWEWAPALSPDGGMLAFFRSADSASAVPRELWVMNLLNGAERRLSWSATLPVLRRVTWVNDATELLVEAGNRYYRLPAPPEEGTPKEVPAGEAARADSLLSVVLGDPPFARVVPCAAATDLCLAENDTAPPAVLAANAHDALAWRGDSVAYVRNDTLRVRPQGAGRERRVEFAPSPKHPRSFTMFPGRRR